MVADEKIDQILRKRSITYLPPLCSILIEYCLKDCILWRELKISLSGRERQETASSLPPTNQQLTRTLKLGDYGWKSPITSVQYIEPPEPMGEGQFPKGHLDHIPHIIQNIIHKPFCFSLCYTFNGEKSPATRINP